MNRDGHDPRKARSAFAAYNRLIGLGLTMMGIILAFTFLGWWLDGLIGMRLPLLTIVMALLGVAGAMLHLFKETGRGH